jgi:ferritin
MKAPLITKSCIKKLDKAIEFELGHFYLYKKLANSMQMLGYFGAQDYFLEESKEEAEHYQKHVDFLNDEGVMATLPTLVPEQFESKTLMDAIENAYANELDLLMYYRDLYNEEGKEYPEIAEHLMFYLKTQREAVGFYGDIIAMFTSEKNNPNINMIIDQKLGKLAK